MHFRVDPVGDTHTHNSYFPTLQAMHGQRNTSLPPMQPQEEREQAGTTVGSNLSTECRFRDPMKLFLKATKKYHKTHKKTSMAVYTNPHHPPSSIPQRAVGLPDFSSEMGATRMTRPCNSILSHLLAHREELVTGRIINRFIEGPLSTKSLTHISRLPVDELYL